MQSNDYRVGVLDMTTHIGSDSSVGSTQQEEATHGSKNTWMDHTRVNQTPEGRGSSRRGYKVGVATLQPRVDGPF